jgi:cation diffusion facilitator family transporter
MLAVLKAIAGVVGNSAALLADAIESTADVISSFLLFIGLRFAQKPPDEDHPYGHGRLEPLITFFIVLMLLLSAAFITWQALIDLNQPQEAPAAWTLWVLLGIIAWKETVYRYMLAKSHQMGSAVVKAEAWHHRSDALTSVTAFIGIALSRLFGKGFEYADEWAALFAAGVIVFNAYRILTPAFREMMDENQYHELGDQIHAISENVQGVENLEKCYVRKIGMYYQVDLHARVNGELSVREGHEIAHRLKDAIVEANPVIRNVHIHVEPVD